mmetsp:Transcript_13592/g.38898  ORF Transcript_13592/g.38898 Transcript_13592/m.38898 type:complete len:211 (-) Transcript_13592:579-1211(-)
MFAMMQFDSCALSEGLIISSSSTPMEFRLPDNLGACRCRDVFWYDMMDCVMSLSIGDVRSFWRSRHGRSCNHHNDAWTTVKLMENWDSDTTSGTCSSYFSMKSASGHSKSWRVSVCTWTLLMYAVAISPIHHGRRRNSLEQMTTRVSVSELTTLNKSAKSRRLSESKKMLRVTKRSPARHIFRRRAKFPAPALWCERKNWNGLPDRTKRS